MTTYTQIIKTIKNSAKMLPGIEPGWLFTCWSKSTNCTKNGLNSHYFSKTYRDKI